MLFKNNNDPVRVRIKEEKGYKWLTVKTDDIVDLPEDIGLLKDFEIVKPEPKKVDKKVDNKSQNKKKNNKPKKGKRGNKKS